MSRIAGENEQATMFGMDRVNRMRNRVVDDVTVRDTRGGASIRCAVPVRRESGEAKTMPDLHLPVAAHKVPALELGLCRHHFFLAKNEQLSLVFSAFPVREKQAYLKTGLVQNQHSSIGLTP